MEDYQERVVVELSELESKVDALAKFLISDNWESLEERPKTLLVEQLAVMRSYASILRHRIELF